jgi:signal transduction histidine kinase
VREIGAYVAVQLVFTMLTVLVCYVGMGRLRARTKRDAALAVAATIEHDVRERTAELEQKVELYRVFVENTDAIAFEYDLPRQRLTYIAPQVTQLLRSSSNRSRREFLGTLIHRDDRERVLATLQAYAASPASERMALQYRLVRDDGKTVYVRTLLSDHTPSGLVRGVTIDLTQQTKLETEVRQAQKLESVGRLAAGVAHEINTPVQYVQDSVQFVREAIGDLFGVIERHRDLSANVLAGTASNEQAHVVLEEDAAADLPYLLEHVPPALERAIDGLGRVTTIVHSLKAFAHPDQRQRSAIDINAAIQDTLEIARHEYKYVADVELDLYDLPRIDCYASEINQVLLNLIINAAHAIEDAKQKNKDGDRGMISVRTRREDAHVEIAIGDTGCGIPEPMRERIFEPFFTTKAVGRGTGQGLSMARSVIVEKHGGSLTFDSTVGVGTTFTIRLPLPTARSTEHAAHGMPPASGITGVIGVIGVSA